MKPIVRAVALLAIVFAAIGGCSGSQAPAEEQPSDAGDGAAVQDEQNQEEVQSEPDMEEVQGDGGAEDEAPAGEDGGQGGEAADGGQSEMGDEAIDCAITFLQKPPDSMELGDVRIIVEAPWASEVEVEYGREGQSTTTVKMSWVAGTFSVNIPRAQLTFAPLHYRLIARSADCTATVPEQGFFEVRFWGTARITTEPGVYDYLPSVSGNLVVFAKEQAAGREDDVWLFDLYTFEFRRLTNLPKPQGAADISGRNVIWVDGRNGSDQAPNPDIYLYDLETGSEHQITSNPLEQYGATIFGRYVAWRDDRNMTGPINGDIYLYDLGPDERFGTGDDGGEIRLTSDPSDQTAPDLYVDSTGRLKVVWADFRDDADGVCDALCDWNVYLFDSGPDRIVGTADDIGPQRITTDPLEQTGPAIYGNRIAWRDARDGDWLHPKIYSYDLGPDGLFGTADDGGEHELQAPVVEADNLDMWEDLLVYDDYRNSSYEIYLYDFSTGQETAITNSPGGQFYPRIQGHTIVWQDARNNPQGGEPEDDIYVHVLP